MRSRTSALLALWLAGAVPWIAYVLSSSGQAYWLDSGEFVAAAVRLDVSHPPGHPLTALYGKAFSLLPLGSLPFRIAIGQAFATALACVLACRATARVLALAAVPEPLRWPAGVFGAWLSAFSYGLWFQAVRPEVYALQTLCTSVVVERGASFLADSAGEEPRGPARYAGPASLALGLGLANHHFTALFLVPALGLLALVLVRRRRLLCLGGSTLLGLLGLATYAYLPLRAAQGVPANLGQPDSLSRFFWVVSAQVYQHGAARETTQPLAERLADVLVLLTESFRAVPLLAAVIGLYVLVRIGATRFAGVFLGLVLFPILIARAYLGPLRSNPDVLGYFGGALLAIGILAACALAQLATSLERVLAERRPIGAWNERLAWLLPILALFNLTRGLELSSLADFHATDSIDEQRLRSLPARSIAIETMPQTVFRHWALDAVEQIRPDLLQVPVSFLTHPGMRDALLRRSPELAGLVDGYLKRDVLRCDDLVAASKSRTVYVELDVRVPPDCYALLSPSHLLHRVKANAPQPSAPERRTRLTEAYARLDADLSSSMRAEPETTRQLLGIHYLSAAQFAAVGERSLARLEITRALALAPEDKNVQALATALGESGEGPLAIAPFLAF